MKVLLLLAGRGTRLAPLTEVTPKPLLRVGDRPVLGHILSALNPLPVEELVVVAGHLSGQIEAYLSEHYAGPFRMVLQTRLDGTGGAVNAASPYIDQPVLVVFGDTIFTTDLSVVLRSPRQNRIWTQVVDDYQRFGIVQTDALGFMKTIVEKPETDVGRNANIGLYYIYDVDALHEALGRLMEGPAIKGEYYFTYALNEMCERGHRFEVMGTGAWLDCGDRASVLLTNHRLLASSAASVSANPPGVTIVPPVVIDPSAELANCRIGPDVSIGPASRIVSCTIANAIIGRDCRLEGMVVEDSIVGDGQSLADQRIKGALAANGKVIRTA